MKKLILIYTFISMTLSGCFFQADEVTPTDALLGEQNAAEFAKQREANGVKVTDVQISGNQFNVTGKNLKGAKVARLKGPGMNVALPIESKTESSLILDISKNIEMISGTIFQLIISDAYGASTFQLVLTVQNGSITNAKIADNTIDGKKIAKMNASEGDVLTWDDTDNEWEPRSLTGQNFIGTWDAQGNLPNLNDTGFVGGTPIVNAGDYLIVINSGGGNVTIDGENGWVDGDWIIHNGSDWDHVPIAVPTVSTFNGSTGAVTFDYPDLDFSSSTIDDFADVDTTTFAPTNGQVLKWDGSKWAPATDNDAGGAGSVDSTTIADGSIVDADISNVAGIAQGKIAGLTGALNGKFSTSGGALSGNLNMANNDITSVGTATVTNLNVTGQLNYVSNAGTPSFENNTDDNNKGDALVLLRRRSDAGSVAGTEFGASLSFEAEGFTNGVTAPQAKVTAGWEGSQTNNTTDRDSFLTFSTAEDGSVTEAMRINSEGYVGIGTNDPTQKLEVQGADEDAIISIINTQSDAAYYPGLNIFNADDTGHGGFGRVQGYSQRGSAAAPSVTQINDVFFQLATGGYNGVDGPLGFSEAASISFEAAGNFAGGDTPGRIVFKTTPSGTAHSPQNRMVINHDGNVGIGTDTPTGANLVVDSGTSNLAGIFQSSNNKGAIQVSDDDTDVYVSAEGNRMALGFNVGVHRNNMNIDNTGKVGIGTVSPGSALEVAGGLTVAISGTVTTVNGNATVVGSGTSFDTELVVGQKILIGGRVYDITSVDNAINIDVSPIPGASDVVSGATAYEMGAENIFEVTDGDGNSILAASPAGVTFGQGVAASSTSNNDAAVITANADGGTDSILLQNNATELMEVKSTGDVEIGNVDFGQDTARTVLGIGEGSGNTAIVMGQDSNNKAQIETTSSGAALSLSTKTAGTDYNNTLYLNQGRVGVNTTTTAPGRMVVNGDTATGLHVRTADQNYVQLQLKNDSYNSSANLQVMDNGNLNVAVPDDGGTAGEFNLSTDGATRVTVDNAGLVGIGADPTTQLHVRTTSAAEIIEFERNGVGAGQLVIDNLVGAADVAIQPTTNGSGTVLRYKTAGGTLTNGLIVDETGNVGVGVDPTSAKLQVDGNVLIGDGTGGRTLTIDGAAGQVRDINFSSGGSGRWTIRAGSIAESGSDAGSDFSIRARDDAGSTLDDYFFIKRSTGNTGIKTVDPGAPLHVFSSTAGVVTDHSDAVMILEKGTNPTLQFQSANTQTAVGMVMGDPEDPDVGRVTYDHSDDSLNLWTSGSEQVTIDSNGELGVGTGSPDALIDVQSNTPSIMITDGNNTLSQAGYSGLLEFRDSANAQVGQVGFVNSDQNLLLRNFVTTGDVDIVSNGGSIKLQADGQVGIGSATPETKMVVSGGTLCVGSDADCDGNNDVEGQIHASLLCDETGANCADISVGLATDIDSLGDASVKTTSLYLGNSAGATDTGSATSKNLGVGQTALTTVGAGEQNIGIGYGAGDTISGGDDNVAVGVTALDAVSNGNKNVGVGTGALRTNVSGSSNVALGYDAGVGANADSSRNVFIGEGAGPNPSGAVDDAIAIGHAAEADADGAIAIGAGAVAGNNQTVIGHAATTETLIKTGDVGIGITTSPETKLHVQDGAGATIDDIAVFSGFGNSGAGRGVSLLFRTPGAASAVKGARISAIQDGGTALAFSTSPDYLDTDPTEKMRINSDGDVVIGTTDHGAVLNTDGDIHAKNTTDTKVIVERDGAAAVELEANASLGIVGTSSNHGFKIKTNNVNRVTVLNDGKVGVDNDNPSTVLHVGDAPTAGEASITNNVLRLEGNSIEDGNASGSFDGTFGVLHFGANNDLGGFIERQYVLTNAYQGGSFAILQSTGVVQPTLTTTTTAGDTVVNGEAVFSITNGGKVEINTGDATPPAVGLEVNGEIRVTNGSGAGIRFEDGSLMTSAGSGSAGSVSANGDSIVASDADGAGGGDILFQIGNGGTPTVATVTSSSMTVGNANNNMAFTTNGGNINAAMDSTTKAGGGFIATNDNSTALNMGTLASNDGGTTYGISNNDLTKITTSGANSTGLLIGTETADPVIFGTNTSEAMRIDANQRLAIGRTTADTIVHIATTAADAGDNKLTMILENDEVDVTAGKGAGIEFRAVSNTTGPVITPLGGIKAVRESSVNANERGALAFTTMDGSSNVNEHVRIDSYGKVGIGTTSPDENFEIESNSNSDVPTLRMTSTNTTVADNETIGAMEFNSNDSTTAGIGAFVRANAETGSSGADTQLLLGTGTNGAATAKVYIEAAGNVGVGVANPTRKLEVTDGSGKQFRMNYDGSNYVELEAGSAGEFQIYNNGNSRLLLQADGDLGLGGVTPSAKLHIQSTVAAGDTILRLDADDGGQVFNVTKDANDDGAITVSDTSGNADIRFNTAGDSYVDGAGQFGIGTTNPTIDLEISGPTGAAADANESMRIFNGNNRLGIGINGTDDYTWIRSYENSVGESDLVLQPSGGKVGIGVTNPDATFETTASSNAGRFIATSDTDDDQAPLVLRRTRSSATNPGATSAGDFEGKLSYELEGFPNDTIVEAANIGARWVGQQTNATTDRDSELVFRTRVDNGALQERMLIDENGYVGIGTSNPNNLLEVSKAGVSSARITSSDSSDVALELFRPGNAFFDWKMLNDGGDIKFQVSDDDFTGYETVLTMERTGFQEFQVGFGESTPNAAIELSLSGITGDEPLMISSDDNTDGDIFIIDTNLNVGVNNNAPHASALLDLTATDRGFLPPRMTAAQRDGITTPATGLVVFNTDDNALNFYNGSAWTAVGSGASAGPAIAFKAHRNGTNQSIPNGGATIDWTTEDFDTNNYFDPTTERFTPLKAGYYLITANTSIASLAANDFAEMFIRVNGATVHTTRLASYDVASVRVHNTGSVVVYLDGVDDYVDISITQNSGSNKNLEGDTTRTFISGFKIEGGSAGSSEAETVLTAAAEPTGTAEGEIYYNTTNDKMYIYNGGSWEEISSNGGNGSLISNLASDPGTPSAGQMYFNTTSNKMKVYNGSAWVELDQAGVAGIVSSADATAITIDASENVGIGAATTPQALLHVAGAGYAKTRFESTDAGNISIDLFRPGNANHDWTMENYQDDFRIYASVDDWATSRIAFSLEHVQQAGLWDVSPDANLEISANGDTGGDALMISSNDDNDGDIMIVKQAGEVGIGTNAPGARLEVDASNGGSGIVEAVRIRANGATVGDSASIDFYGFTTNKNARIRNNVVGANQGDLLFDVANGTNFVNSMYLKNDGNVGIGNTNPGHKLDVDGNIAITGAEGKIVLSGQSSGFAASSELSSIYTTDDDGGSYPFDSVGNLVLQSRHGAQRDIVMAAGTTASVKMVVKGTNGRVGIGTTAPDSPLEVAGVIESSSGGFKFPDGSTQTSSENFESLTGYSFKADTDNNDGNAQMARFYGSLDSEAIVFKESFASTPGSIGLGTFTPAARFDIQVGTGSTLTPTAANKGILIETDQSISYPLIDVYNLTDTIFHVNNDGNIGIGSNTPSTRLFVADSGAVTATGSDEIVTIEGRWTGTDTTQTNHTALKIDLDDPAANTNMKGIHILSNSNATQGHLENAILIDNNGIGGAVTDKMIEIDSDYTSQLQTSRPYYGITHQVDFPATGTVNYNHQIHGIYSKVTVPGQLNTGSDVSKSNLYGARFSVEAHNSDTQIAHALYLENEGTPHASHYGLYQEDAVVSNYFAGDVGIGTSTPGVTLDVADNQNASTYVKVSNSTDNTNASSGFYATSSTGTGLSMVTFPPLYTAVADRANRSAIGTDAALDGLTLGTSKATSDIRFEVGGIGSGSERMRIQSDGLVGIGTTSPASILHIEGSDPTITLGDTTNANSSSIQNVDSILRYRSDVNSEFSNSRHEFHIDGTERMRINTSGNVGIGDTSPAYRLEVDGGDINTVAGGYRDAGSCVAGTCASDRRFKKDIDYMENSLAKIRKLRPANYFWRVDEFPDRNFIEKRDAGLIAQEVEMVFPEMVITGDDGYKKVRYGLELEMHMLASVIQLDKIVQAEIAKNQEMFAVMSDRLDEVERVNDQQDRDIASLKEKVENLESENEMLKSYLCKKDPDAPFCQ